MNEIERLRARREQAQERGQAILTAAGDRALTDEESTRFDACAQEIQEIDASIERHTQALAWRATAPAVQTFSGDGQMLTTRNAATGVITNVRDLSTEKPWGTDTGAAFGEFLLAVRKGTTSGQFDSRLLAAASGMNEAVGADGGFAVPVEFAAGIEKEMWETGEILSRVNVRPITGNNMTFNVIDETSRADGSRRGAVAAYWVEEAGTPDPSQVKLAKMEMKLRKVAALGYLTEELAEDAPALEAELTEAFREELIFEVEDAIINGTGAGQPLGILRSNALVSVAKESGQAAATIEKDNVDKMWARMRARNRANSVWIINQEGEPQLNGMTMVVGTGGVPVYLPPGGLASSPLATLYGRPVIPVEYCAALGTVGDIMLVDLGRYRVIRQASGPKFATSMHVRFVQGENTYRATYRVDGQPIPRTAITPKNGTNALSPFVALATRS